MPNVGKLLKDEISRLSKREARQLIQGLAKAVIKHRHEIAALKRRISSLEALAKRRPKQEKEAGPSAQGRKIRFSAGGLRTMRHRLGLSAAELGKLIEVSEQSVYLWEIGRASCRERV